jgi:4-amino-4-deoxy-L-arabinose transferase-like glycosyltransferase
MLTYLIGRDLFDRRSGWIAAAFQGISPTVQRLVQGYLFSDHIDVALLFWTELGIYFGLRAIRGGFMRDSAVAGIACGLAYLSKYFLALLVPALLLATLILVRLRLIEPANVQLRWRHAVACMLAAGLTAAPWLLWCFIHFRQELVHEHLYALAHLTGEKEGWAAPWDRLLADYWPTMQAYLFMPVVVAAALLGFTSWRKNRLSLWFVGSWLGIVVLPHILAASKTPTGTVLSIPAGCLMFGALLSAATRSDLLAAAGCIAGTFAGLFGSRDLAKYGKGPAPSGKFAGVLLDADWLITQTAVAATCMAGMLCAGWFLMRIRKRGARVPDKPIRVLLAALAIALAATLAGMSVKESWRVASLNRSEGSYLELGTWVRSHLEPNAVLLLDVSRANEAVLATLWSDRTCYPTTLTDMSADGGKIKQANGIPYIVSRKRLANLSPRYSDPTDGWIVYEWTEDAGPPTPAGK